MSLQRVMIRTLLGQNIAVLLATTLFALVLSLSLVAFFVFRPEAQRAALVTAGLTEVLAVLADGADGPNRVKTLQFFDSHPDFSVKVSRNAPSGAGQPQTLPGRFFLRELKAQNNRDDPKDWRIGDDGWLWVQLTESEPPIWVSFRTAPRARSDQSICRCVYCRASEQSHRRCVLAASFCAPAESARG